MGPWQIPEGFEQLVREHIRRTRGEDREHLGAPDFGDAVRIRFFDGSFVYFEFAFFLVDGERKRVAVFTEHCGYHVFPLDEETEIKQLQTVDQRIE